MIIFSSLDKFQILDYSSTHSRLLIRSLKNKERDYNIDVIIKGVLLLLIPSSINGLEISMSDAQEADSHILEKYGFKMTRDYRIFCLKDLEGKKYFINAMCFGIYHNRLDILETSIGRYDMENFGENVLWYAE